MLAFLLVTSTSENALMYLFGHFSFLNECGIFSSSGNAVVTTQVLSVSQEKLDEFLECGKHTVAVPGNS